MREPVVVLGAGIVGISTAYFLSCHGVRVTLVDRVGISPAASGKAGGFLAKNWVAPALAPLAAASFSLHESLATRLGVDAVDYRRLSANNVTLRRPTKAIRKSLRRRLPVDHPAWVDTPAGASVTGASWCPISSTRTGSVATCAQVHPAKLCHALVAAADDVDLVVAAAVGLDMEEAPASRTNAATVSSSGQPTPRVRALRLEGGAVIPVGTLVLALGPWSDRAATWLPDAQLPHILGHQAHSVVLREVGPPWTDFKVISGQTAPAEGAACSATAPLAPAVAVGASRGGLSGAGLQPSQLSASPRRYCASPIPPEAVFFEMMYGRGPRLHPEIYPRPHGEVYVYGAAELQPKVLPDDPAAIVPSADACDRLTAFARSISSRLSAAPEATRQACCLPVSPDGLPLIGPVPGTGGTVLMGAGHGVWGVLLAPATGLALTQLILTGQSRVVDLSPFSPGRFADGAGEEGGLSLPEGRAGERRPR